MQLLRAISAVDCTIVLREKGVPNGSLADDFCRLLGSVGTITLQTLRGILHCNKYNASIPFSGRRLLIIGKEIQHKLSLNKATFIWELSSLDWFPRDTYLTHLVKLYQDLVQWSQLPTIWTIMTLDRTKIP